MEEAADILSILVIPARIPTIFTADGAGIRILVITAAHGEAMRPAAIHGRRAAGEERAGAEALRRYAAHRFRVRGRRVTPELPGTAVAANTAAGAVMAVERGASSGFRAIFGDHLELPIE
jgi:hypothetical protein